MKRNLPCQRRPPDPWLGRLFLALGLLMVGLHQPWAAEAGGPVSVRARDFLNSVGVCSAVSRRGEDLASTVSAVRYLGVRWVRAGYESGIPVADLIELHRQTGVRFSYGLMSGGTNIARVLEGARQLASAGALLAMEGNNEPNNWGVTYEGQRGGRTNSWLPVAKLQRDLYRAVTSDLVLKDYPVWSLSENGAQEDNVGLQFLTIPAGAGTLMPDDTRFADYANCHNYLTHPGWPGLHDNQTWVAADPSSACRVDGLYGNYGLTWRRRFPGYSAAALLTLPRVTTETGVTLEGAITEEVQARLYLSVYLDQFKRGWKHTAIYLLRDRTDERGNQTFGFYRPDYTPRLAATYLHNLTTILADEGSGAPTGGLAYSIPDQPATVHDLLLQKGDGTFELVIWDERFTGGSDSITVNLGGTVATAKSFDPTIGTSALQNLIEVSSVGLTLSNHPVIIEVPALTRAPPAAPGNGIREERLHRTSSSSSSAAVPVKLPVILDTDIGTDIDDAFALALVLTCPELDLRGVTTVSDDAYGRALIACRFLEAAGRSDVPVAAGRPRRGTPAATGQYEYGLNAGRKHPEPELAVEFLYQQLKARPGELTIITLGDLTNVGELITRYPEARLWIRKVVMMGGSVRVGYAGQPPPEREWNIRSDVRSAQILFRSGIPLTVAPLDATLVRFPEAPRRRVFETPKPVCQALWSLYKLWGKQTPTLFDPVAVTLAFNESFVTMESLRIEVDDLGFTREVPGEPNCRVAVGIRADPFLDWYVQRIARAGSSAPRAPATAADDSHPADPTIANLIQRAGATEDESERLRLLRQLEARSDLDPVLRADLGKLLPVVDDWADGKSRLVVDTSRAAENGYLCRFITGRVRPAADGPVHPPELSPGSPLRPIWCFYRGRMLIWQVIQSSPLLSVKERRERYYGEGRRLLEETHRAFPENRVVRMYLGEPIPWPKPPAADPEAPGWANLQREGIEKLADVIHWWVAERQLPDGQFGGGWGDDVEMWRWWTPVLIAFEDPVVSAAQERLSSGIFQQPHLRDGFTSRVTDVEHSNEDTTDTILPMMHLRPDDPVWKERALRLAELMRDRWTGRNERGFLQFKSIYFSVDKVDTNTARAFDTVYHPSVIQPALLYWQRTGDPALTALFGEWLKVWVDAAARAENEKPAGVLPSAIRWPEGGIARTDLPWWEPFPVGHNDALYNWPSAMRLMTSTLLLAHHMSREENYLEPIRSMAALRLKHLESPEGEPGSEAWCARRMSGFLSDALAKYRLLTGDTRHDALLRGDASGYVRYRLTGDRAALESALRRNAKAFRSNWEAYTREMRWTDRVMSFTRNFLNYLPETAPPAPSPEILYNTATGDPGNPLVFPLNAVRWRTPPRDIAALVTESGRTTFAAELFHFGDRPRDVEVELFLLSHGEYELTLTAAGAVNSPSLERQAFRVEGPGVRVPLQLPARRLCVVRVATR